MVKIDGLVVAILALSTLAFTANGQFWARMHSTEHEFHRPHEYPDRYYEHEEEPYGYRTSPHAPESYSPPAHAPYGPSTGGGFLCATEFVGVAEALAFSAPNTTGTTSATCLEGIAAGVIPQGYTLKVGGACTSTCNTRAPAGFRDFLISFVLGEETVNGGGIICGAETGPDFTDNCTVLATAGCCRPATSYEEVYSAGSASAQNLAAKQLQAVQQNAEKLSQKLGADMYAHLEADLQQKADLIAATTSGSHTN